MPIVTIYGIPEEISSLKIEKYIHPHIREGLAKITDLGITEKDVIVNTFQQRTFFQEGAPFVHTPTNSITVIVDLYPRAEELLKKMRTAIESIIYNLTKVKADVDFRFLVKI